MDESTNEEKFAEPKRSNRKRLIIIISGILGLVIICCCGLFAYGTYLNSTPEGQANATTRAEQRQATRVEQTVVAAIKATESARSTITPASSNTPIPTDTIRPTLVPEPTNTLAPTNTVRPTLVPEPTNTLAPTNTVEPTKLPEPTSTLAPTETSIIPQVVTGIGVTRSDFLSVFTDPDIDFTFEESSQVDGQPRIMGTSPNGLAYMELIGPPDNLVQVSMMIGVPSDNPAESAINGVYLLGFLKIAMPDWPDGSDWLTENIETVANGGEVSTSFGNRIVTLHFLPELSLMLLTIEAE